MKVTLLYLHVVKSGYPGAAPPEYYLPFSRRWVQTLREFNPGFPHSVRILCCGAERTPEVEEVYRQIQCDYDTYTGAGSDIGACQFAMPRTDADLVVCMSTPVYFWNADWLKHLVKAYEANGDGIYGPMASYQCRPHIRTSCWMVSPKTFPYYPHLIDTREKCCWAEHAGHNGEGWQMTHWFQTQGKQARMVTWMGSFTQEQWRSEPNVFRKGDQSNCMVWDQHVDVYRAAHYHERLQLEALADGKG